MEAKDIETVRQVVREELAQARRARLQKVDNQPWCQAIREFLFETAELVNKRHA